MSAGTPDERQGALANFAAQLPADGKVTVNFKHAGDAPILKKSTFKLPATTTIATVADQLRKQLQLAPQDPLVRAMRLQHVRPQRLGHYPAACGEAVGGRARLRAPGRMPGCAVQLPLPCSRSFCTAARRSRPHRMRSSAMSPSVSRWELFSSARLAALLGRPARVAIVCADDPSCYVLYNGRSEARSSCTTVRHQHGADCTHYIAVIIPGVSDACSKLRPFLSAVCSIPLRATHSI